MILTYDAIDAKGQRTADTVEATDVPEAVEQLRGRGLFVTRITEADRKNSRPRPWNRLSSRSSDRPESPPPKTGRPLPLKTLALFTRQMAMLLKSGSGVVPAVAAIKRQMKKPEHASLLAKIVNDLEEGATLTDALRKHPRTFDPVYCAVVAAGEASGAMPEMFERLAQMVGRRRATRNTIVAAMAYPALLIVMCAHIFAGLLLFVLPRFNDMFTQLRVETPTSTKMMLALGDLMRTYWFVGLAGVVLLGLGAVWLLRGPVGRQWLANVQTMIPVLGKLRSRLITAQVLRTMGTLLENRVGVLDSLELVRGSTRNNQFQKLFSGLEEAVTSGGQVSAAFEASGMIEPYICQAVRTGEDSGNLGGAMSYCADILDETNAELVKVVTRLMEPVILIMMGGVVGFVAVSLFMPLFDMTSAMK